MNLGEGVRAKLGISLAGASSCMFYVPLVLALMHSIIQWVRLRQECASTRRPVRRSERSRRRPGVHFDSVLLRRIMELLRICFPKIASIESGLVLLLVGLLTLRTALAFIIARIVGKIGRALLLKDVKRFLFSVFDVAMYSIPATVTSVGIYYTTSNIEICFRERLQSVLHEEYFSGNKIYDLALTGALDNPGHRVTYDAQRFCSELASLLSSLLKPLMDIILFSFALTRSGGYIAPLSIVSYYVCIALLFRSFLPNFAGLVARSRSKGGHLRMFHTQIIQHAEEVAFYRGTDLEGINADRFLRSFVRLEQHIKRTKWWAGVINSFFVGHGAICVGYGICAFVVSQAKGCMDMADLTQLFIQSKQLYISFSMTVGKLLLLHLKVSAMCGSANRIGELRDAIRALEHTEKTASLITKEATGGNRIVLNRVSIISPSKQVILSDYNAVFEEGSHVMIMGCNGSGKTALLRAICGIWPLQSGTLEYPAMSNMIFLTQRVYLPPGTLRTQLIYPAVEEEECTRGLSDETLLELAMCMGMSGVVQREGGLDARKEWGEVLSGGERQRIALIRAMYHRPTFVFLDECTSAISQDIEPTLYEILQRRGMTLITISHHEALKVLHHETIKFGGMDAVFSIQ